MPFGQLIDMIIDRARREDRVIYLVNTGVISIGNLYWTAYEDVQEAGEHDDYGLSVHPNGEVHLCEL